MPSKESFTKLAVLERRDDPIDHAGPIDALIMLVGRDAVHEELWKPAAVGLLVVAPEGDDAVELGQRCGGALLECEFFGQELVGETAGGKGMHYVARGKDVQAPIHEGRDIGTVLERELEEAKELVPRNPALDEGVERLESHFACCLA